MELLSRALRLECESSPHLLCVCVCARCVCVCVCCVWVCVCCVCVSVRGLDPETGPALGSFVCSACKKITDYALYLSRQVTGIATEGFPYSFTRNPLYCNWVFVLLPTLAALFNTRWVFVADLLFFLYLDQVIIPNEESFLMRESFVGGGLVCVCCVVLHEQDACCPSASCTTHSCSHSLRACRAWAQVTLEKNLRRTWPPRPGG